MSVYKLYALPKLYADKNVFIS